MTGQGRPLDVHLALALAKAVTDTLRDDPDTTVSVEDSAIVLTQGGSEVYLDIDPALADDFRKAFSPPEATQ